MPIAYGVAHASSAARSRSIAAPTSIVAACALDDLRFHVTVWYEDVDLDDARAPARRRARSIGIAFHVALFQLNAVAQPAPRRDRARAATRSTSRADLARLWRTVFRHVWAQWRWEHDLPDYAARASSIAAGAAGAAPRARARRAGRAARVLRRRQGQPRRAASCSSARGLPFATLGYAHSIYGAAGAAARAARSRRRRDRARARRAPVDRSTTSSTRRSRGSRPELGVKSLLAAETPASVFAALPLALARGYRGLVVAHEASANAATSCGTARPSTTSGARAGRPSSCSTATSSASCSPTCATSACSQPIHDEVIFELLARDAELAPLTHSCNVRSRGAARARSARTSGCSSRRTCRADVVDATFGDDLGERADNERWFRELLGLAEHTPFECVGSAPEARLALALARARGVARPAARALAAESARSMSRRSRAPLVERRRRATACRRTSPRA